MSKFYDPTKPLEEAFHKKIKSLTKRDQGYVMGAFREHLASIGLLERQAEEVPKLEVPEYADTQRAIEVGVATPLDIFVYHNEPAGDKDELDFRVQLAALVEQAVAHGQARAYSRPVGGVADLFTCKGKGGEYAHIGIASGAGPLKGKAYYIYKDTSSGAMFARLPEDFWSRMERQPAATIAASAAQVAPEVRNNVPGSPHNVCRTVEQQLRERIATLEAALPASAAQAAPDMGTPAPWKVWQDTYVVNEAEGQVCKCELKEDAELIVRLRNGALPASAAPTPTKKG